MAFQNKDEALEKPNKRRKYDVASGSEEFIKILEMLPDEVLSVAVLNLSIPDLLTVCRTNTNLKNFCEGQDFWKRYFEQNKSENRSSGISVNEHHMLLLQHLRDNTPLYDSKAYATIDEIEYELLKADKHLLDGFVYRLLTELREDRPDEIIDEALKQNLFINEPILMDLISSSNNGRRCKTVFYIYSTLLEAAENGEQELIRNIVPILDIELDKYCFDFEKPSNFLHRAVGYAIEKIRTNEDIQKNLEIIRNISLVKNYSLTHSAKENLHS
jgi:hypothetical protein